MSRRLAPGTVLGERYEVVSYLRSGGMSDVYRARERESGDQVAVKLLPRLDSGTRRVLPLRETGGAGRPARPVVSDRRWSHSEPRPSEDSDGSARLPDGGTGPEPEDDRILFQKRVILFLPQKRANATLEALLGIEEQRVQSFQVLAG